jgi:hypothetical protein
MVIAPEHRRRGLVTKLMTAALENLAATKYDYVFNLSAGDITLRTSLAMGWGSAGWARPMRWRSWRYILQSRLLDRVYRLPGAAGMMAHLGQALGGTRSLADVDLAPARHAFRHTPQLSVEDAPRCDAMAELIARIGGDGRIRHVRDSKYFRWRFQNPLSRYRFIYWDEGRLEGYLVQQEYTSPYANPEVLNIVDWEASDIAIQEALLDAAFSTFAKMRPLTIWSATLSKPVVALLERRGFHSLKPPAGEEVFPTAILVRPVDLRQSNGMWTLAGLPLLDTKSWDLSMLISMLG